MTLPVERSGARHVYHLYVARHAQRDAIHASTPGIGAAVLRHPLHLQPVFAHLGYRKGQLPVAEEHAETGLALPMHPHLTDEQVDEVVRAVGTPSTTSADRRATR